MAIFVYTFVIVFVALVVILGLGSLLAGGDNISETVESEATESMCTTQLLGRGSFTGSSCDEDMVYTYDSFNL